jgi:hypothetical protein
MGHAVFSEEVFGRLQDFAAVGGGVSSFGAALIFTLVYLSQHY